jgi:hypothetical protein
MFFILLFYLTVFRVTQGHPSSIWSSQESYDPSGPGQDDLPWLYCNTLLGCPVGPQLIPATLIIFSPIKVTVQLIIYLHFTVCTANCTLCIYPHGIHFVSFWDFVIQILVIQLLIIDYFQLLSLLCIIQILEIYPRYFEPIINIYIKSQ